MGRRVRMVSDIAILNDMIKDTAKISPEKSNRGLEVILTESKQPDSLVTIFGLPNDVIIIKVDKFKEPDTIFNCSGGKCKRSDFAIIADTGNKKVIIHIEIKAAKGKPQKKIIDQLKGSDCVIAYCQKVGQNFYDKQDFLKDYKPRFVAFIHTRIPKTKTRQEHKNNAHGSPDDMLMIDTTNTLTFNHLAGI